MKKLILVFTLMLSFQSFADCRPEINRRLEVLNKRNSQTNQNLGVGVVLGGILTVAYAPVGIALLGISGVGSGLHELSKMELRKLKGAVDQAYVYSETGEEGKDLKKLLKKVKRKIDNRITMEDLVESIISSNQNESLCKARNLNQFAKTIEIEL